MVNLINAIDLNITKTQEISMQFLVQDLLKEENFKLSFD